MVIMMRPILSVAVALLAAAISVQGQSLRQSLEDYYGALGRDHEMNGNVAVSANGRPLYRQSFGYRNVSTREPNDGNSQFDLASVSKLFTTTAFLQLKERRLIDFARNFPTKKSPSGTCCPILRDSRTLRNCSNR
jgi:CubicO group peptidase (beta-lactamase class C family)